jgi:sulfate adenylyltransferase
MTWRSAANDVLLRWTGYRLTKPTKGHRTSAPTGKRQEAKNEAWRAQSRKFLILMHVATPLEECERRDRKGLYAKARAGILTELTGISDPYEEPSDAEVVIDTTTLTPEEAAQQVLLHIENDGYLG